MGEDSEICSGQVDRQKIANSTVCDNLIGSPPSKGAKSACVSPLPFPRRELVRIPICPSKPNDQAKNGQDLSHTASAIGVFSRKRTLVESIDQEKSDDVVPSPCHCKPGFGILPPCGYARLKNFGKNVGDLKIGQRAAFYDQSSTVPKWRKCEVIEVYEERVRVQVDDDRFRAIALCPLHYVFLECPHLRDIIAVTGF